MKDGGKQNATSSLAVPMCDNDMPIDFNYDEWLKHHTLFRNAPPNIARHLRTPKKQDILILDSGGGWDPTVTKRAWHIHSRLGPTTLIQGYQSDGPPKELETVHAITKLFDLCK